MMGSDKRKREKERLDRERDEREKEERERGKKRKGGRKTFNSFKICSCRCLWLKEFYFAKIL